MPKYLGVVLLAAFIASVAVRAAMMRKRGIKAFVFGKTDKSDFLLMIIVAALVYDVFGSAFGWPIPFGVPSRDIPVAQWFGVLIAVSGIALLITCLKSFGDSFRVGIDAEKPDKLVTDGMFAYSRNPVYCSFFVFFAGMLLIYTNTLFFFIIVLFAAAIHRQVLREEEFLRGHYGEDYEKYCEKVRRYF